MKSFFIKILGFTIFGLIFYMCVLSLWGSCVPNLFKPNLKYAIGRPGHSFTRLKEVKKIDGDIDILFLGSSHTSRGFDTRIFEAHGLNTFNLGTGSQTPIQTLTLVRRYLDQINPKLLVYEVYPVTFIIDGVEGAVNVISNDANDMHSLEMALKTKNATVFNTFFYSAGRQAFGMDKFFSEPIKREDEKLGGDTYIEGGFVEKESDFMVIKEVTPYDIVINKVQLKAFEDVLEEVNSRGIDFILVNAPISKAMYNSFSKKQYYDSLMCTYGRYYNFNEMMNVDDILHFYDRHHLSQIGVELFNAKLIETMEVD